MDIGHAESEGDVDLGMHSALTHPPKAKRTILAKYTRQACAQCRKAKTRCEGGKPACARCQKTGHECNWTFEDARRPLTRAHEQALKHQNTLLRAEVARLTREVEALRLRASQGSVSVDSERSSHFNSSPNPLSAAGPNSPGMKDDPFGTAQVDSRAVSTTISFSTRSELAGRNRGATPVCAEDRPLWGGPAVEDITSDAQEDINVDVVASDSEDENDDLQRPETEFDCDVESAYESGTDCDDDDSDEDVDKALVAPTKTLFSEQDDLHHYGFTSVFRLREPALHWSIRSRQRLKARSHRSASVATGYDSAASSHGVHLRQTEYSSLRAFLSSSAANETTVPVIYSDANSSARANLSPYIAPHVGTRAEGTFSDSERFKQGRKGQNRRRLRSGFRRTSTRTRTRTNISPVRTQRHVLLVDDTQDGDWKGCDCQSDCWSRWLPKCIPLSRREHDILLDRVFRFFTSWCMRIIPEYFLRDMHTFLHPSTLSSGASHIASSSTSAFIRLQPTSNRPSNPFPRLAHYSPFLHNMLLAVGTAFSSDPVIRDASTRKRFADEGKSYLDEECSRPNISTVQALGLLASYYSGQGQQTLGFTYFGMSARIAQALGLFADCTPLLRAGRLSVRQVFDRTWCFHMAAAQDACWSLYVGRECGIPLPPAKKSRSQERLGAADAGSGGEDANKNGNRRTTKKNASTFSMEDPFCLGIISEGGIGESLDRMTWRTRVQEGPGPAASEMGEEVEKVLQCETFTTLQWSCQLMKIGRSIIDLMNRLASSDNGTEIKLLVADIDIQLDVWRQDLPAELKLTPANEMIALPHKLMMHAAFWWQRILLHRPFYQRHRSKAVESAFSVTRCNVAAREILSILRLWRKVYGTVRYCPITLIQAIFAAGTVYILQTMQASSGRRPAPQSQASALDNLEELVGYLRECSESWDAAIRVADIFEKLLKEQRRVMQDGASGAGNGKRSVKRRGKLETFKEDESAGHAAHSVTGDHASSEVLLDGRANDSGYYGESSSSPAALQQTPTSAGHFQGASWDEPQRSLFSSSVNAHPDVSPVFASPIADTAFSFSNVTSQQSADLFPGGNIPTYPTGYLSDDSYMSDAPYMSMDDFLLSSHNGTTSQSSNAHDADWNFLLNSEAGVNMDVVMPGMSMGMYDPSLPLPGLSLGSTPTGSDNPYGEQRNGLDVPGFEAMDAYALSDVDREGFPVMRRDQNHTDIHAVYQ